MLSTKSIYGWDEISQTWINGGNIAGPAGETLKISSSVDSPDHLPARPAPLTTVLSTGTRSLFIYDPGNPQASAGPATPAVPEVPGAKPGDPPISPAVPAKPPAGWVELGRIDGPQGPQGSKGDPGLDKGTVEGQILRWSVGLDKWVGGAAPVVTPAGTNTGDTIVWNSVMNRYDSVPLATLLPTATDDKQVFTWDAATGAWQASSDLANIGILSFSTNMMGEEADRIITGDFSEAAPGDSASDTSLVTPSAVRGYVAGEMLLEQISDCTELAAARDGQSIVWSAANSRWEPGASSAVGIPFFRGTFSAGNIAPTGAAEGDIWVDQTSSPPVFKEYIQGVWTVHDFATATNSLGLLGDLANVNLGGTSVEQGDALIYDRATEKWTSGSVPAHIKKWKASTSYTSGTTIFHNGSLWTAAMDGAGVEPQLTAGDVQFLTTNGTGRESGPFIPTYFNTVTDITVAPTAVPTGLDPDFWVFAIQYGSALQWSLWKYNYTTVAWERQTLASTNTWRSQGEPARLTGNNTGLIWIYDLPTGTATPKVGQTQWATMSIHTSLSNLTDTDTTGMTQGSILQYDGSGKWRAVGLDIAKIGDFSFNTLADGNTLIYNAAAQKWENKPERKKISDLTDTNAASPTNGNILVYDSSQSKWAATAPLLQTATNVVSTRADASALANGDALVWDAGNSTWRPAPLLQKVFNSASPSATMGLTEAAIKTALDAKEPKLPAHVAADVSKILVVAADGSLLWAQPASPATTVLAPVANATALPATANNGDIIVTLDDTNMYVWAGTPATWHSIGGAAGGALPGLPAVVTENLVPVGGTSRTVTWKPIKLQTLDDVDSTTAPEHGTTPVFNKLQNKFIFGQPDARIDNWSSGVTYSRDALTFHDGQVWRCRLERSLGDTPSLSNGQVSVYYTSSTGRMSGPYLISYIYTGDLDAEPTDIPTRNEGTHVALRYTNDTSYTVWTWEFDSAYFQTNHAVRFHWVKVGTGGGIEVWRHPFHPPKLTGNNKARLWIFGDEAHTYTPITGSQNWEIVDFSSSLVSQRDVSALGATRGQVLVSDGAGKWNATTLPTLPSTSAGQKLQYLRSNGTSFEQVEVKYPYYLKWEDTSGRRVQYANFGSDQAPQRDIFFETWLIPSITTHLHLKIQIGGVSPNFSTTTVDIPNSWSYTNFGSSGEQVGAQYNGHIREGHGNQIVYADDSYKMHQDIPAHCRIWVHRFPNNMYSVTWHVNYQSGNFTGMSSQGGFMIDWTSRPNERVTYLGVEAGDSNATLKADSIWEWK